ncbi:MAG: hypothetical protein N4A71_05635 [Carboxylicivirga sp.]|jgi:hypothetical protein|nr:hypothetical protein [Carboxylicivirga sp.]
MEKEYTYQSETISYPNAHAAGSYFKEIVLDSSYERCTGIAILESQTGGIPAFRIGLNDKDNRYISAVHKDLLKSDKAAGLDVSKRFLPVNIKAQGHKVKVATVLPAPLASDLEYDIVFLLERDKQKV